MVFCNDISIADSITFNLSHNPYFNRWFSAIEEKVVRMLIYGSHNPYFNRWFSAIQTKFARFDLEKVTILILIDGFLQFQKHLLFCSMQKCHNPYFNRWFSAMQMKIYIKMGM